MASIVKESKYCRRVMKNYFCKEYVMTKDDDKNFESSRKCWICYNIFVEGGVKVRDHWSFTGKYRGVQVRLNCKIPILFHNLKKKYDAQIIKQ